MNKESLKFILFVEALFQFAAQPLEDGQGKPVLGGA